MTLFKNIPEEIETQILEVCYLKEEFPRVVRFIDHAGKPLPSDFIPTFVDPKSRFFRERMASKGEMAKIISLQAIDEELKMDDCCVSLQIPVSQIDFANTYKKMKRHFPYIALGRTDNEKGYSFNDKDTHVMYFLKDYDTNNPFVDFDIIEEESLWTIKSL